MQCVRTGKKVRLALGAGTLMAAIAVCGSAQAQTPSKQAPRAEGQIMALFQKIPSPQAEAAELLSEAEDELGYRSDASKHLYAAYPKQIHKGLMPPLMYAIAITETEIDENGEVVNAVVVREPAAAKEVVPWVLEMIHRAAPFPKHAKIDGHVKYTDVWFVDKTGTFQLKTLTEGQR